MGRSWLRFVAFVLAATFASLLSSHAAYAQQADLSLTKTVSNSSPNVGDIITFTITVANAGPDDATSVTAGDLLPTGLTFVSAMPSVGTYDSATGAWAIGAIAAGPSQTLQISARVTSSFPTTNTAAITHSDQSDPNTANNSASATVSPQQADLSLTKTVSNSTPNVGDTVTFTITVANAGPNTATNVTVGDLLPTGLTFVSASPGVGTYDSVTGSWAVGAVAAGSPQTLQISARLTSASPLTNTATITHSDQFDPNTANNSASVSLSSGAMAPTISAAFGASSIPLNGTTSLTFTITNPNSSSPLTGIAFADTFPAGLVVATPSGLTGSCGAGSITATAGSSTISLSGGSIPANGSCSFSVNVMATSSGTKSNTTSAITSNEGGTGNTASATLTVGALASTTTALASSANPSQAGQTVTLTATVSASGGGTPTGTVTFKDGATLLGSATLSAGMASFTTSSLARGTHSITAAYGGSGSFLASTSPVLMQVVNTPADSLKLRAMQVLAAPMEAQASGQAIDSAVNSAITEGFGGGGAFMTPSGSGVRINFAADPETAQATTAANATDPFAGIDRSPSRGLNAAAAPRGDGSSPSRIDSAFGALAYAAPTKAPPRYVEQPDWLGWAEVHGAVLDHGNAGTVSGVAGAPVLYGDQINLLAGLTRRLLPNVLVGVLGGYETFDYRSDELQGRLKGDGWTVGSYVGWLLTAHLRADAALSYSGIGYDGTAGTAAATFGGQRLLVSGGLTGSLESRGWQIEPSARVYALWEREDAYTDTLGTAQPERNFSTGRASGGVKVSYPIGWSPAVQIVPYAGVYGDYYFNTDDAGAVTTAPALPTAIVLDGWSARANGGIAARFANGAQMSLGGERGGLGGGFALWTYYARASVPFSAQ